MIGNAKARVFAVRGVAASCQLPRAPPMRGIRTDLTTYLRGATALAEGLSIRATGRLVGIDKDTTNHWLPTGERATQRVHTEVWLVEQPTGGFTYLTAGVDATGQEVVSGTERVRWQFQQDYGGRAEPLPVVAITDGARTIRRQ